MIQFHVFFGIQDRKTKRFFFIGGAIIALGVIALVWRTMDRGDTTPSPALRAPSPDAPAVESPAGSAGLVAEDVQRTRSTTPWRVVDERAVDSVPPYDDKWSRAGRALVDVSSAVAVAGTWREGDLLVLDLPQVGGSFEGSIDRITDGPGYSRSVRGLASDADGRNRRFVLTVGPTRVYAYIDTADGPYELLADTRLGWLLPTSSLLAGFDFSEPDYILPRRGSEDDRAR